MVGSYEGTRRMQTTALWHLLISRNQRGSLKQTRIVWSKMSVALKLRSYALEQNRLSHEGFCGGVTMVCVLGCVLGCVCWGQEV